MQIIVSILLTNFNLRKIAAFISGNIKEDAEKQVNGQPVGPPIRRSADPPPRSRVA